MVGENVGGGGEKIECPRGKPLGAILQMLRDPRDVVRDLLRYRGLSWEESPYASKFGGSGPPNQVHATNTQEHGASPQLTENAVTFGCSHEHMYEQILGKLLKDENYTFLRETMKEKVFQSYVHNKQESQAPTATFVWGATAVGKSTFLRSLPDAKADAIHVNADDLRAHLVGGYDNYTNMLALRQFGALNDAAKDCNVLRLRIQDYAKSNKINFVADSYSVPGDVIKDFKNAGYNVNVYYLELEGKTFEELDAKSFVRIEQRMLKGGHSSSTLTDKMMLLPPSFVRNIREMAVKYASQIKDSGVEVWFYTSDNQTFDYKGTLDEIGMSMPAEKIPTTVRDRITFWET